MSRWVAPILAYHAVHPLRRDAINVTPANFDRQMRWLHGHGYQGVSLAQYVDALDQGPSRASKLIALTFDDGYQDNLTYALPILQRYGFTATVFVITGMVGATKPHYTPWLEIYPDIPAEAYRYLTWDELRSLQKQGIEIGSHTCTHPFLDQVERAVQCHEIRTSKEILEANLQAPIPSFCYPAGHFTDETLAIVREAGYGQAVVTPWTYGLIRSDRLTLKRVGLYYEDHLVRFRFKLSPFFELYRTIRHGVQHRLRSHTHQRIESK